MSDRIEKLQGGRRPVRGGRKPTQGNRNPLYLRGNDPELDTSTTPPKNGIHLRGMSGFDKDELPTLRQPPSPSSSSFNPEAATFTPTASTAFVNTPDSSPADPQSVEKSLEEKREQRLREINSIEDSRDREDAMNDFLWDQHTKWSDEDLAKEKEEKELEERRQKFGRHHKDSPSK